MNNIDKFKSDFSKVVGDLTLNDSNWKAEGWKNLWTQIDQELLNDAFKQQGLVQEIFSEMGEIAVRSKSLDRIKEKMAEANGNNFRPLSDLIAGRLLCRVDQIKSKIDQLKEIVFRNGGQMHVKGASEERPYGFFVSPDNKYTDIVSFVYIFMEKVGYPLELQIGHEFAMHTFNLDSELRNDKKCEKKDLWQDNFYLDMRNVILAKANLLDKAKELHQGNVPEDLQMILNRI